MTSTQRTLFYIIFAFSGFAGLIYESIWTRYLKLFLGHSAYAQSLVIVVFMGGMAIGSWISGRFLPRWKRLLIGYAVIEGIIGLLALVFHESFVWLQDITLFYVLPTIQSQVMIEVFQWIIASLLILPQTILLGMTFPLMSSGILRSTPQNPGKTLSMLYFTNSIGGFFGVLASGFILINQLGLPGTIRFAGFVNICLASVIIAIVCRIPLSDKTKDKPANGHVSRSPYHFILLFIAFFTGVASFIYEVGWIRMLSLVLGTSSHSFEIMLATFILGLALGSAWVSKKIDSSSSPLLFLACIQICMGLLAAATLPVYGQTFKLIHWLVLNLPQTDTGYILYLLSSSWISMSVMFPAAFCAGMTLPLITKILLNERQGEKNIGYIYALNTGGSIIGVLVALHFGFIFLGLKNMILAGALVDILLGAVLIISAMRKGEMNEKMLYAPAGGVIVLGAIAMFTHLNQLHMVSGVYNFGTLLKPEQNEILYYQDGKTSTISVVFTKPDFISIATNGKPDASISTRASSKYISGDDPTQIQVGAIPMALNPEARQVANIGLGSGVTSSVILKNPLIERLDTVEIEPMVLEGARHFGKRVQPAFDDPRSNIIVHDARTFFALNKRKYDIIISEPSNPWVSGVASLFTQEFYGIIKKSLKQNGIFAQWVQLYNLSPMLLGSIFKAIDANFDQYEAYALTDTNMLIIAKVGDTINTLDSDILAGRELAKELEYAQILSPRDIEFRWIGGKKTLKPYFTSLPGVVNSDFTPILDQHGAHDNFLNLNSNKIIDFNYIYFNLARLLENRPEPFQQKEISYAPFFKQRTGEARMAVFLRDYHLERSNIEDKRIPPDLKQNARKFIEMCSGIYSGDENERINTLFYQGVIMLPVLTQNEIKNIWDRLESLGAKKYLNQTEYALFDLFRSINQRDGLRMQALAMNILNTGEDFSDDVRNFLIASALAGDLITGNLKRAGVLWSDYKEKLFAEKQIPPFFAVIESHLKQQR